MADFSLEKHYCPEFPNQLVAGVDEAGRGPLAGNVVAAAVIFPKPLPIEQTQRITDSKKLSAKQRLALEEFIKEHALWAIGEASVAEIDQFNIFHATFLAMQRAINGLQHSPAHVLIDGKFIPALEYPATAVIKGDSKSISIAAASILAKVHRDALMTTLHQTYPHYHWQKNAGYGTAGHLAALKKHGITPHHRRSFAPVRELIQQQ